MTQELNFNGVLNTLSIGQVSYNILRELYRRQIRVNIFPKYQPDLSAYDVDENFGQWLSQSVNNRYKRLNRNVPTLSVWHLNGSEAKIGDKQYLFTFHECSEVTEAEKNIAKTQDHVFFSSSYSVDNFKEAGVDNVSFVPLGLDEDIKREEERSVSANITHWGLVGKHEKRKKSDMIIRAWMKKYAGNPAHQLTICAENPFYKKEQMDSVYAALWGGKSKPFNINILPRLKTNAEMVQVYNSFDIDLSGLSGAEGWGLPAFNATALGKWSIVLNATAHKDWATVDNSILVEPSGMELCYDGIFFKQGQEFNQGAFYSVTEEAIFAAMDVAASKAKTLNAEGLKLAETMTYKKTVDGILAKIFPN